MDQENKGEELKLLSQFHPHFKMTYLRNGKSSPRLKETVGAKETLHSWRLYKLIFS